MAEFIKSASTEFLYLRIVMVFILVFLLFGISSASAVESSEETAQVKEVDLSLAAVIERALATHPEILASQKGLQEAGSFVRQAGLRSNPELQISGGSSSIIGESGDQEWSVAYVHTIELGNKRKKRLSVAEIGLMIARQQLKDRKRQLVLDIKRNFADFLSSQDLSNATNRSVELHKKLHEFTVAKVDEGEAAAVEQSLSHVELNRLELEKVSLATSTAAALSKLRLIAGLREGEFIKGSLLEDTTVENRDLVSILAATMERNPQLQISRLEYQQTEAMVSLTKAEAISDLDFFLQYSNEKTRFDAFGFDQNGRSVPIEDADQIVSTGISFKLPFSRNQGNTAAAVARLEQAKLRTRLLEKTIEQEVTTTFRKYQMTGEAYRIYRDSIIKQSENQVEIMRVSFESGELRFLDWMNEQKRALEIQRAFVLAARDYFLASAELEFLTSSGLKPVEDL